MANNLPELRTVLLDVALEGAAIISKPKLVWYLGRGQDRPSAWAELLDEWVNLGQARDDLHGLEVFDKIVLTKPLATGNEHKRVVEWTDE